MEIKWDKKFELGVERIDHEHRVFVDLIHNAARAAQDGSPVERILRLLGEIRKYAEFHFYSEENIMIDIAYPGYDDHREDHSMLLARLDDMQFNYRNGIIDLDNVVEFLYEWFAMHTTRVDSQIADYLDRHPPTTRI